MDLNWISKGLQQWLIHYTILFRILFITSDREREREREYEGMEWIHLTYDRKQCKISDNMAVNLWVPQQADIRLSRLICSVELCTFN
jgi:hypothetical protein